MEEEDLYPAVPAIKALALLDVRTLWT